MVAIALITVVITHFCCSEKITCHCNLLVHVCTENQPLFYMFYVWKISIAKIYITSRISLQRSLVGTFFFSRFPKKRWKNSHKIWFSACSTYHEPRGIYSSPANDIWYRMHLFPKWLRQSANNLRFFLLSRKPQRRNVLSFPPNHFYYYIRKICNWGEKVAKLTLSFFQKIGKKLDTFHTVWP